MVKKYYLFLGLLVLLQISCFGQHSHKGIEIKARLSVDTCYNDSCAFEIGVTIVNKCLLPKMVFTNKCISENTVKEGVKNGELFLLVTHEGVEYRYNESVILYKHELPRKHLLWFGTIKSCHTFYMNHFIKDEQDYPNDDYGSYTILAAFVDEPNDTIYSNPVTIQYLERPSICPPNECSSE